MRDETARLKREIFRFENPENCPFYAHCLIEEYRNWFYFSFDSLADIIEHFPHINFPKNLTPPYELGCSCGGDYTAQLIKGDPDKLVDETGALCVDYSPQLNVPIYYNRPITRFMFSDVWEDNSKNVSYFYERGILAHTLKGCVGFSHFNNEFREPTLYLEHIEYEDTPRRIITPSSPQIHGASQPFLCGVI